MDENQMRQHVAESLKQKAAPGQRHLDPLAIAQEIGFDTDAEQEKLIEIIREEAARQGINML